MVWIENSNAMPLTHLLPVCIQKIRPIVGEKEEKKREAVVNQQQGPKLLMLYVRSSWHMCSEDF